MPDFKQTFQEEVRRLARKELKAFEAKISEQKKTISALTKRINELEKKQSAASVAPAPAKALPVSAVPENAGRKVRFSPKSLVKFRKKYSLSQKALAVLLGVTPFTVSHWEIGKNRPRTVQIEAFNALSKLGKRKLYALVSEKAPGEIPVPKKTAKKSAKKTAAKTVAKKSENKVAAASVKRTRKKAGKAVAPAAEKKA